MEPEPFWNEARERPRRAHVGNEAEDKGGKDPPAVRGGDERRKVDLGKLGEQDVAGDGPHNDHDERAELHAFEANLLDGLTRPALEQDIPQVHHELLVLVHGSTSGRGESNRLKGGQGAQ